MNGFYLTPDLYIALYEEYFRPCQHQQDLLHQSLLPPVTETMSAGDGGDGVVLLVEAMVIIRTFLTEMTGDMIWFALAAASLETCSVLFCLTRLVSFSWLNLCSSCSSSERVLAYLVIRLDGAKLVIFVAGDSGLLAASSSSFLLGWAAPRCTSTHGCLSHPRHTRRTSPAWRTNTFQFRLFSSCSLQSPGFCWQPSSY